MKRAIRSAFHAAAALGLSSLLGCAAAPSTAAAIDIDVLPAVLAGARQLLVVTTPSWDAVGGELRRYERPTAGSAWTAVGTPAHIVVGKNGMAWDPALVPAVPGPTKREGDGRAPAGAFALGTAFGLAAPSDATWLKLPYVQEIATLECVDDPASAHYNRLVDRAAVATVDWNSSEKMAQVGAAYRWGVVVEYNTAPPIAGRGSCIFLHVSPTPGTGTAGCTAMPAPALDEVMRWLDPARRPALVQMPAAAVAALSGTWKLPT
jgi:L,D-peptidoglycan transpeptidase YkuD (ErfK/YbiS/YcfS/YnhG family)